MILRSPQVIQDYTSRGWWINDTWSTLLAKNIVVKSDADAVIDPSNRLEFTDGAPRRLSWAELGKLAENIATHLIEYGVRADDIVVVQLPNTVELVAMFFAAAFVRCIISPLPVQFREYEIEQI